MKEEMYVPGQDDFPGWDEFYSPRVFPRERMRYSFKTLLLLPPLVALVCFMYLMGYKSGIGDEQELRATVEKERQALAAADNLVKTEAASAASSLKSAERANRETHLAMSTVKSLVSGIQTKLDGAPSTEEARGKLRDAATEGLKQIALTLKTTPETPGDHGLVASHLDLGDAFLLLSDSRASAATEDAHR